eukprot:EC097021.1.p2 GENE.EC097021.1~~EC097021.1.p2  ORF type:complete len:168 (+),score=10.57 EC097021.1:47-550(+)
MFFINNFFKIYEKRQKRFQKELQTVIGTFNFPNSTIKDSKKSSKQQLVLLIFLILQQNQIKKTCQKQNVEPLFLFSQKSNVEPFFLFNYNLFPEYAQIQIHKLTYPYNFKFFSQNLQQIITISAKIKVVRVSNLFSYFTILQQIKNHICIHCINNLFVMCKGDLRKS